MAAVKLYESSSLSSSSWTIGTKWMRVCGGAEDRDVVAPYLLLLLLLRPFFPSSSLSSSSVTIGLRPLCHFG
jgi:hypothetical protein